jgi:inosine/xanthosine triphosphate pyrophosphatase family protein/diadenosine tetraphosphate (Ap4A) HIT family hydrolase
MLTLVSSNPAKYAPFASVLERLRIEIVPPGEALPELQVLRFQDAVAAKARAAAHLFKRPVLVDDAGLVLEAYAPFPGPLTSTTLRSLGVPGLQRLLAGVSDRAVMECHLGIYLDDTVRTWVGSASGRLDFSRVPSDGRMILSELFVPDDPSVLLPHRAAALRVVENDAFSLHLEVSDQPDHSLDFRCASSSYECPFCCEFDGESHSVFKTMIGGRLESRIVYEDEHFVVMPPLGSFIPGGLLLLSRDHIPSFAHLKPELFPRLERLLSVLSEALRTRWGVSPLVFEHGTASDLTKGGCCVDHAHFNIFPAQVSVQPHLAERMSMPVRTLEGLTKLRRAEFGYLFIQENDGQRRAYDGHLVPTQLVRRIITKDLGFPERWHWRDYPGYEELLSTYHMLTGQLSL